MNVTSVVTVLAIFFSAFVAALLKQRSKDRVLSHFHNYHVTLEKKDDRLIWGEMHVFPAAVELEYAYDWLDEQGHIETSYILYKNEFRDIQGIYRYVDELNEEQRARRDKDVERSFHPGPLRLLARKSRNFMNAASDSFYALVQMFLREVRVGGERLGTYGTMQLKRLGKSAIGYAGTSFDPVLETYIGEKVVVEVVEDTTLSEIVGVLKDYTSEYLEILNVQRPESEQVELTGDEMRKLERNVRLSLQDRDLHIKNLTSQPLLLHGFKTPERQMEVNAIIDIDDEIVVKLDEGENRENIQLEFKVIREMDMILPRAHAMVRHGAERYDAWELFTFGQTLKDWVRGDDEEERYLREAREDPDDGIHAVNLGLLYERRGDWEGASKWLTRALELRHTLPDKGEFATHELKRVKRRKAQKKTKSFLVSSTESAPAAQATEAREAV
jgi:tetratricopeptide (TPR) repeat protein